MPITAETDLLTAVLGRPLVWAYGRHVVAGNIVLLDDSPDDHRLIYVALGEGVWDSVVDLWLNGESLSDRTGLADGQGYLFHPGKAGELGTGGETGSQKMDRWFPTGVTQLNFSHAAYVSIWADRDTSAPGPDLDIRGIYQTRKLQEYDSSGTPTVYQYSANPAWEILDLLLNLYQLPTSRMDFASFVQAAADCDVLVNGQKRFEGHAFFTDKQGDQALDKLLASCRGFLADYAGKISLRVDQARSSVHDFTLDNIAAGSFHWENADTSRRPNRIVAKFRDIANNYAFVEKMVDDEAHQDKLGRISRAEVDLGNSRYGQVFRIGKYLLGRSTALPELVRLRGLEDSFHLMPGDVVRVKHDAAPWIYAGGTPDFKEFEVLECTDLPNGERDFLLNEYLSTLYTDDEETEQALQSPAVQARAGLPAHVTGQAVSEGPGFTRDGHAISNVTVSFTSPSPKKNWAAVRIYVVGLAGGTKPLLVAQFSESPGTFQLESTNETVTFYFVSVAADGRERAILTSPSSSVLLDGQTSAPVPVSNLTGQAGGQLGQVVRLTWSENIEVDLEHYEIARRATAATQQSNITDTDIIATVKAAGQSATRKAQWDDAPGSGLGTQYYYARAVNKTGLASAWRPDPPATLQIDHKAPDATSDTAAPTSGLVPGSSYIFIGGGVSDSRKQAGALVIDYSAPPSIPASNNMAGVVIYCFEMKTWADINATTDLQTKLVEIAFDPLRSQRIVLEWENRYLETVKGALENYFGLSVLSTLIGFTPGSLLYLASQAQDAKPPTGNFDPSVQDYGARKVIGRSTGNLQLDTNSASAEVESLKRLDARNGLRMKRYADLGAALDGNSAVWTGMVGGETGFVWDGTNYWFIHKAAANKWKAQMTQVTP